MRIFVLLLGFIFLNNVFSGVLEKDSLALVAVYDSTDGANWNNPWDLNSPVSSWSGVSVQNNRVTQLSFSGTMNGTLPQQITDLDSLTQLRFYYTQLDGQFPANIGNLKKLEILNLTYNNLEGEIPAGFYTLTNLKEVSLGLNNLSGGISSDIGALTKLYYLGLNNNSFSGSVPPELGNLTGLTSLDLSANSFSGTIPAEICSLPELKYLNLDRNELSGTIPTEIGNLAKLENLRLANNDLEGEIPSTIGNLDSLMYLAIDQNNLSGTIPAEIANCEKLSSIRAGNNSFTGLPDLSGLTNLTDIWIPNNQFSGPLPDFFYNMPQIGTFNIGGNNFEGELKPEIANWQNLSHFYFGGNNFSGEIPKEVGMLKKVTFLELYSNNFEGEIPAEIAEMENLRYLRLYDNNLTGTIPQEIGNVSGLRRINLKQNNLEGDVPENFSQLQDLEELELADNKLSYLPEFWQTFSRVGISGNRFTFEDIEPFMDLTISSFYYLDQDTALKAKEYTTPLNSTITLNMKIGGSANHYNWFKDGQLILENDSSGLYSINAMQIADTGHYYCEVSNDLVPDLTIITHTVHLQIGAAMADSLALVELYNATNGDQWTNKSNWLTTTPLVDWYGIDDFSGNLKVDLSSNNLSGEVPSGICNLISTEYLDLSSNNLSGTIPGELGRLTHLNYLDLSGNNFSGRVPEDLLLLDNLVDLNLSDNNLSVIPDFNGLPNPMADFFISGNAFTFGDLEKNIGSASQFIYEPQDSIGEAYTIEIEEGQSFELAIETDGTANHYQWYRDGVALPQDTNYYFIADDAAPEQAGNYSCRVTNDIAGDLTLHSRIVKVIINPLTNLNDAAKAIPQKFDLAQNYPNPFNPATKIRYTLPQPAAVKLSVYNTLGQVVAELVNGRQQAGYHSVQFKADNFSSGLYFYILETNGMRFKRKMLLIK